MNASISKSVVVGDSFIEHRYSNFRENFEDTWIKTGHTVDINATNEGNFCESCLVDQKERCNNWSEAVGCSKNHSYPVPGVTNSRDYYEWYGGRCRSTRQLCWGNVRRFFKLREMDADISLLLALSFPIHEKH